MPASAVQLSSLRKILMLAAWIGASGVSALSEEIKIPFSKSPLVNGVISPGEWSNAGGAEIKVEPGWTVQVLFEHDTRNLYVAFLNLKHGASERYPEVLIDTGKQRSHSWQRGQWWLHASYNLCEGNGAYGVYFRSGSFQCSHQLPGWTANLFPLKKGEAVEFQIAFSKLIVEPGAVIGIAFVVTDTRRQSNLWPGGAKAGEPNTWGEALIKTDLR